MRIPGSAFPPATILLLSLGLGACTGEGRRSDAGGELPYDDPEGSASFNAPILAWDAAAESVGIPGWRRITAPHFGDLDEMVETRIIRAGVVSSRSLFFLDGGQPRGITYDGLSAFEEFLNERLGSGVIRVHVVMIPLRRDQLLPALVEGRVDLVAANLTITPDRLEVVDFSAPLLGDVSEVLVTGRLIPAPASPDGLSGFEIHVRRTSSYFQSLQALNERLRRAGRDPVLIREADELLEDEDLMELVNAGVIPATVVDNLIAQLWSQVFQNVAVHPEVAIREGGEIGWAFRKGSPGLKAVLADFAREHRVGTLSGNVALRRYLGTSEKIVNPLDREGEERLAEVFPVFEEYAVRYGFDPVLLLAQAFQESHLDQNAVSPVGAVGIMQLMPSTAADPNVGIPDVTTLENNVHAGAKYLRFLLDHYFSDAEMDSLNEHLFAFAAYNAGAGRVAGLRAEAAELGLDPNRWFQNVELVAARRIGQETVRYVNSIYKYYLTYARVERLKRPVPGVPAGHPPSGS